VDTQGTLALNLLRGDWLNRLSSLGELLILALVGVGFGFGLVFFRPLIAVAIALAGALCVGLLATAVCSIMGGSGFRG